MSVEAEATSEGQVAPGDVVFNGGVPIGIALEPIAEGGRGRVMIQGVTTMNVGTYDNSGIDAAYDMMEQARIESPSANGWYTVAGTGTIYDDLAYINNGQVVATDWARTSGKERFPDEVVAKAWKLLEGYMSPNQYFAFMEKSTIELENDTETFRLLINKAGNFTILEGETGAGIVASSGRIRSYEYPLGDEIATFIDHFRFKTKELIGKWACGTYGIVKDGQRR